MKKFSSIKVSGQEPATLLKIELLHRYFSTDFSSDAEHLFCIKSPSVCFCH